MACDFLNKHLNLPKEEKEYEKPMMCASCKHNLGAECCRLNVEHECREGGGFELWEAMEQRRMDYEVSRI